MEITRLSSASTGRSPGVARGDTVYVVATAGDAGDDLQAQTAETLARIEQNLEALGSDKTKLLQATVYLGDISRKAEMDEVWNAWIGPENWPQRACIGVDLAPGDLVEIVVVAAR